jgi:S1-C subfamily serine protease
MLGTPTFTVDGKVLGIAALRVSPNLGSQVGGMGSGVTAVILPAEDVLEIAQQALKQKDKK